MNLKNVFAKSSNFLMLRIGVTIVAATLIFSFILPIFYSYDNTEVFYKLKETTIPFGEARINDEYNFYALTDSYFPEGMLYETEFIKSLALDEFTLSYDGNKYCFGEISEYIYKVNDGIDTVGVVTCGVVDFYELPVGIEYEKSYAYLLMNADKNSLVYDENGVVIGEVTNCIIRAADGADSFTYDQKRELRHLLFDAEPNNDKVYSETLDTILVVSETNNSVSFKRYDEKILIDSYSKPSAKHLLGTDSNGNDVLARLMYGGQISLIVGIVAAFIGMLIGVISGCLCGLNRGFADLFIMRFVDVFESIPALPVFLIAGDIIADIFLPAGMSVLVMIAVISLFGWSRIARAVRIKIIELRSTENMHAAEIAGIGFVRKMIFSIVPEILPQITSFMFMSVGSVIMTESTVSFFGLGVRYPYSTWGIILSENTTVNELGAHPSIWIPAVFLICTTVIGFYLTGESIVSQSKCHDFYNNRANGSDKEYSIITDTNNILEVSDLNVEFENDGNKKLVADNVCFTVKRGGITALVGASGCGKSVTADVITGLLDNTGEVTGGTVVFNTKFKAYDLLNCGEDEFCRLRGRRIGYIMQEPMSCFDPLMKVGKQLEEAYCVNNRNVNSKDLFNIVTEMISRVGFENPAEIYEMYPEQLSGGMCQRIALASVLLQSPDLIIADESCSSLDIHSKPLVLELLKETVLKGASLIIITHNIKEAMYLTDNIVFVDGMERKLTDSFSEKERFSLLRARGDEKPVIKLRVERLSKVFGNGKKSKLALDDISFELSSGTILGITGAEGSGKTTLAGILSGIINPTSGIVFCNGADIINPKSRKHNDLKGKIQLVFQHPYKSLSKNVCVGRQIREVVHASKVVSRRDEYRYVIELLKECGLGEDIYHRRADALSGGQCKRVCIARAIAAKPEILICDEPLAHLDTDLHGQITELLVNLTVKRNMSLIYISHDIEDLELVCDEILVLKSGKIIDKKDYFKK
ncbi:MAG: ATP-binding cassette domain-containing protein [Ruminococcaceae bacterium]|nr:ATP-binding cassette domain-containing protein [Oscillospiraceae bacterium]